VDRLTRWATRDGGDASQVAARSAPSRTGVCPSGSGLAVRGRPSRRTAQIAPCRLPFRGTRNAPRSPSSWGRSAPSLRPGSAGTRPGQRAGGHGERLWPGMRCQVAPGHPGAGRAHLPPVRAPAARERRLVRATQSPGHRVACGVSRMRQQDPRLASPSRAICLAAGESVSCSVIACGVQCGMAMRRMAYLGMVRFGMPRGCSEGQTWALLGASACGFPGFR
jgi:hypothetical protein